MKPKKQEFPETMFVTRDNDVRRPGFECEPDINDIGYEDGMKIALYRLAEVKTVRVKRTLE